MSSNICSKVLVGSGSVVPIFSRGAPGSSRGYHGKKKKSCKFDGVPKVRSEPRGAPDMNSLEMREVDFVEPHRVVPKVVKGPVVVSKLKDDGSIVVEAVPDFDFDDFSMCEEDVVHKFGPAKITVCGDIGEGKCEVSKVVSGDDAVMAGSQETSFDREMEVAARDWIVRMVRSKVHYFGAGEPCNDGIVAFLDYFNLNFNHVPMTRFSAFCMRCDRGCYYGVYDADIQKLSHYILKEEFAFALFASTVDCCWAEVYSSMFEDVFVPQGGEVGVKVVNWRDDRLPERFALIDDVAVNCSIEDCLRFDTWHKFGVDEFANAVPALAHFSCNYCDECGGVDMCRHILSDILDSDPGVVERGFVDLGPAMIFVKNHVFDLLRLRENPGLCSVSSPHIRYAIARSMAVWCKDVRVQFWMNAAEKMCYDVYPNRIVPQGFFGDAVDAIGSIFGVVVEVFAYVPKKMYAGIRDLISWVVGSMRELAIRGLHGTVDVLFERLKLRVNDTVTGVWESVKPYLHTVLKTIVRVCIGYTPTMLMLEFAWDADIFQGIVATFLESQIGVFVPQGPEDFSCALAALGLGLFVAMGKLVPKFKLMSDLMSSMILTAGAFNRSMLWDQFGSLRKWFDGDERAAKLAVYATRYPNSMAMVELYEEMTANDSDGVPCAAQRVDLGYFYSRYLVERKRFGAESREVEALCFPALKYIASNGVRQVDRVRARPACFMFWGASGLGKSKIVGKISTLLAHKHAARYSPGDEFSTANAIYHVNVGDDYVSGYDNQDIWVFDEWLQEKDSDQKPSKSINLLFTLISTLPCKLNMAAVDDKGKTANVAIVLGATNHKLIGNSLGNFVKSIHDTAALEGRVSTRVQVKLKEPYVLDCARVCIKTKDGVFPLDRDVDQGELYTFALTNASGKAIVGDLDAGEWSWKALLQHIDREYVRCIEYNPEDEEIDLSIFESGPSGKEEEKFEAQGWFDWLPVWKKKEFAFYDMSGDVLTGEYQECYKDDTAAVEVYKVGDVIDAEDHQIFRDDGLLTLRAVKVFVKHFQPFDIPTVAMSVLLLSVALVAAVPLARKLKSAVVAVKDLGEIVVDGVRYWWHGEEGCYSAQGGLVEVGGVKFFKVFKGGAYKFYPQGPGGDMLKVLDNQRLLQQIPVIYDSLFTIVIDGKCVGNAFAHTDCRLVTPTHIGNLIKESGCLLLNGKVCVSLEKVGEHLVGYNIVELGGDCSVIELNAFKLNGVRNNLTKFSRQTPVSGLCRQVFRDAAGVLHVADGTYGGAEVPVVYSAGGVEFSVAKKDARFTSVVGHQGMCGCIYVNLTERPVASGGVILGYHIAANHTTDKRVFRVLDNVVMKLSQILHSAYPSLDNPKGGLGAAFEMESGSTSMRACVHPDGRLGMTPVPAVIGAPEYQVALLKVIERGGIEVDPMLNSLSSLSTLVKREISFPADLMDCVKVVSKRLCKQAIICNPDWVGTYQGAKYLPPIQRTAASGAPWGKIGTTKDMMCLSFEELAELGLTDQALPNAEALRVLDDMVNRILTGGEFEAACTASIKEEPRLAAKVEVGASRIFAAAPVHEFLLQRRFFMGVLATFLRKNVAVHSALGVDPSMYGEIHKLMLEHPNVALAFFDHEKMDKNFQPMFMDLVAKVIRSVALGFWVGDEIHGPDDYVRAVLLTRLTFNRLLVGAEIIEPKGGQPSGSALTSIISIVANIIIFCYGLSKMMRVSFEDVFELVMMMFLGDDSVLAVANGKGFDLNVLIESAKLCGFTLTAGDKVSEMRWVDPEDLSKISRSSYEFLSRRFTETEGVLSMERLSKMMMFCEERRALETVPQAISSFQDEIARYERTGQFDWMKLVEGQVKHFGFRSVEEFLGCSKVELVQCVLNTFMEEPEKMKVVVPAYNRKKKYEAFVAQGPGDDEPRDAGNEQDAEFLGEVETQQIGMDMTDANYLRDHMDPHNYASKEVFGRPVVILTGSTGVVSDTSLFVATAASSYFINNFNAQAKLTNAIFMRCKFCLKVIVASGPFVTGRLLMEYAPGPTPTPSLIQASGNPCTEIDLAAASSAVIKFDTVLPGNWMMVEKFVAPLTTSQYNTYFDYGFVQLWTMTPPSVSVPFTVYAWLEDVELRGAGFTAFGLSPQGKDDSKSAGKKADKGKGGKVAGVKSKPSQDYAGELELKKWQWKIENTPDWLNTTAASVETVGGCVETIESSILGPVGDFLEKAGEAGGDAVGAAIAFGMSVPPPRTHIEAFMQAPVFSQAQMMTNIPSVRLAVVQCQRTVTPRTLFGNRGDEMNIKEFCARASVVGRFPWGGSAVTGETLANWNVMPGVVASAPVGRGGFSQSPSPLAYVAGMFRMWRGSIKYRLSVVKTAFHTGTLEVVWQMGYNTSIPITSAQDALSQRYIWDITQSSSIEFEVPYVARTPFTQIYFIPFEQVITATDLTTGQIYVNVINPLTNSSGTVPSNVTVVVYISGGPDIEFAVPGRHSQLGALTPSAHIEETRSRVGRGRGERRVVVSKFVAQGGPFGEDETVDGLLGESLGFIRPVPRVSMLAHLSTIGERVLSMRLLIKRFGMPVPIASSITFGQALLGNFYLGYLTLAYAFWVGSWRVNLLINPPDYNAALFPYIWTLNWNNTASLLEDGTARMSLQTWSNVTVLEVPWYGNEAFKYVGSPAVCSLEGPSPPTSQMQFSAGDDFSYGFQVGIPSIDYTLAFPEALY